MANDNKPSEGFAARVRAFVKSKTDVKAFVNELRGSKNQAMYRRIFMITAPAFVELFLSSLFSMVDMVMVGNMEADVSGAISSVGITNQPFFLLISFFAAVNVGTTTLVAWKVGSGETKDASSIVKQSVTINTLMGIALGIVGILAAAPVMGFMSKDPAVVSLATEYLQIICAGLPFMAVTLAITGALRGAGQTKVPMLYNIAANFANVIMNYLLIYGHMGLPRMGVAGAALATTISRVMACAAAVCYMLFSKHSEIKLSGRFGWRFKSETVRLLFSIGIPSSGEQLVIQSGLLIYSRIVSGLGTNTYDAHQIAASVNNLAFSVSQAFSVSTTTLVGQAAGAGDYDLAERYTRFTRRAARLVTAIIAVALVVFAANVCRIYTKVEDVISIAVPVFYFMALVQFVQSSQMSTAGALRGAGDTMYPFYSSLFGIWCFRVPLAFVFVNYFNWGLNGAWLSFFIDQCIRSFLIKRRFNKGTWKEMKSRRESKRLKTGLT